MELIQAASDDQIALLGCAMALVLSGAMMYVSYFVGRANREAQRRVVVVRNQISLSTQTKTREANIHEKAA